MFAYMADRYDVELEPEVQAWLDTLSLASRHLDGAVRELRFHLGRSAWRVTYWLAPQAIP